MLFRSGEKAKKQEDHFKAKRDELQTRIKELEKEEKRMATRLKSAKEAQAHAEGKVADLEKDLSELHQQVGPAANAAEKAQRDAQIARTMSRQRRRMLQDLVVRARIIGDRLGVEVPSFTTEGSFEEAGYAGFFERFLARLEETAQSLDERIVEESRDLLVLATCRIFANLAKLQPSLDLEAVTAPIDISCPAAVSVRMRKAAEEYAVKCDQVELGIGRAHV